MDAPEIDAHLRLGWAAPYALGDGAIAAHDLDRDGVPDRIMDWGGVTCGGVIARPFCGAAIWSIDVFLSSRPGDPQSFLGIGYTLMPATNGAPRASALAGQWGLARGANATACSGGMAAGFATDPGRTGGAGIA